MNESHLYAEGSGHIGVDGSAGVTIGLVQSKLPLSQFNAETLMGLETGWSGSIGPVGTGEFTGYDLPSLTKTYTGKSFSLGVGVKELPGSLTAYAGWTERIGKIQSF